MSRRGRPPKSDSLDGLRPFIELGVLLTLSPKRTLAALRWVAWAAAAIADDFEFGEAWQ